ncbi:MAG: diadenosine tetraphosphate hydrolase [Candidatus Gribaldobacteria bacterium]|nr:diadenosine tetraphosphate hydrolase [Candidatus Gribaldobacteria bacterium]
MPNEILFPDEKIIVTEFFDAHQDWSVPIPGFFIIEPLRKIRSVAELNDQEAIDFINLIRKIRLGMKDVLGIVDVYLFQNENSQYGFHLWMFPRHQWMEQFGRKIESVRPIMNYAKENMVNEEIFQQVKGAVAKMREYLKNFQN